MQDNHVDVAIVGGGPGGYTAALYCARAGLETLVLEKLSAGGQMATTSQVENYPGFDEGIDGFELAERMQRGAQRFGARTLLAEVTGLDLKSSPKVLETSAGRVTAFAVILATGASPRALGVQREDFFRGRGVAYCATCDGMMYRGKTVVVVGGGNSAAEDARYLTRICRKVYLVHRRDTLRASKSYLNALEGADNLEFVWNATVTALQGEKRLSGVTVRDTVTGELRDIACDGLFVAIGREPNTALFRDMLPLDGQGYLIADETTKTALPGVFAVGDVRQKPLRQIVTAAADGATASKFVEEYLQEQGESV